MITIPEALRAALAQADEAYLAGLSNKGTVNRAKKDLEKLPITGEVQGDAVQVSLGEAQCVIRAPLGDSACSCPSQAMCRHRVAAMLWLKEQAAGVSAGGPPAGPEAADFSPLLEVAVDKLRRALGTKAYHDLIFRLSREGLPLIIETSVVQVELPDATVKLLLPLEHSNCSCRSKELCRHKAAALLCYQIIKGRHTLEELEGASGPGPGAKTAGRDREQVSAAAQAVRDLAAGLLDTGLSRLSGASSDSAQRLASLCHVAGLPRLESGLRSLSALLERAVNRSAAFRTEDLLLRLADLDCLAQALEAENGDLAALAGTFRDEYQPIPPLTLSLLGERQFHADSGYAGTVYYFWELDQRRWYSYTVARPTFYEGRGRRPAAARVPAPWGLNGLMDQLYGLTIVLGKCKATADRRLSSTESAHGEILSQKRPWEIFPPELCWDDFSELFQYLEPHLLEGTELERLVFLRPAVCKPQAFDRTNQLFRMLLSDAEGRTLPLEVRYRAEESALVQTLEVLADNIEKSPGGAFLALAQLSGEDLSLYPVEYYSDWGCAI